MVKIVLISGSMRRDSVNTAVVATVRRILAGRSDSYETSVLHPGELPFYNWDVEQQDGSEAVRAARALVSHADALIISTPSYNGEAPGVLKNALDWLSRPFGRSALTDQVVALVSASPGVGGGIAAQPALAGVLTRSGARLVEHEPVAVGKADQLRTDAGDFTEPSVVAGLESLLDATLAALDSHVDARV